jgi:predicted metalloprotease
MRWNDHLRWPIRRSGCDICSLSLSAIFVLVAFPSSILGENPSNTLPTPEPGGISSDSPPIFIDSTVAPTHEDEQQTVEFIRLVLVNAEEVWPTLLRQEGIGYHAPKLILFRREVDSSCGTKQLAFYCATDGSAFVDLQLLDEFRWRMPEHGDFAQAQVIAHEFGHHVQRFLEATDAEYWKPGHVNQLSMRQELQADFLAGVWVHHLQKTVRLLDPGDIEEGLALALSIGEEYMRKQCEEPECVLVELSHGTPDQRIRWFRRGFETGDLSLRRQLLELDYDDL